MRRMRLAFGSTVAGRGWYLRARTQLRNNNTLYGGGERERAGSREASPATPKGRLQRQVGFLFKYVAARAVFLSWGIRKCNVMQ